MPTITALVHTKNSAKTLDLCLSSLRFCDEVFVIDMESSDETLAIAKKHKEKQIQFADPIRNHYIKKVKTDWTLIVDSDEEVPETLAKKFQELMTISGVNGYKVPRANIIFGKWMEHSGFWPDYIVRFFRTGTCSYPSYVHSQPVIEGVTAEIEALQEFALIHHHYDSVEQYLLRLNVYTTLETQKIEAQGITPSDESFLQTFFAEFHRRFFAQEGYKDGKHGLVVSLLQAIYMLVVQMKLWEKAKHNTETSLDSIELSVNDACRATSYWVANEKVKKSRGLSALVQKVRRKLVT